MISTFAPKNTENFENVIKNHNLQYAVDFYLKNNKSKYLNSYHGYYHARQIVCLLAEFDADTSTVLAGLFHDFNYQGTSLTDDTFDIPNIQQALAGIDQLFETHSSRMKVIQLEKVKNLISKTEFPKCHHVSLTDEEALFVDCDHSNIIYDHYPVFATMLCYNEMKNATHPGMELLYANPYFKTLSFKTPYLQAIWETLRETIIHKFVEKVGVFYGRFNPDVKGFLEYNNLQWVKPCL